MAAEMRRTVSREDNGDVVRCTWVEVQNRGVIEGIHPSPHSQNSIQTFLDTAIANVYPSVGRAEEAEINEVPVVDCFSEVKYLADRCEREEINEYNLVELMLKLETLFNIT
ncbi:hypothetical protein COP1_020429 [Malus domestica]